MRALALVACLVVAALVFSAAAQSQAPARPLPGLAPGPDDALSRALAAGRLTEAEYALERARSLFQLGRVRREFGDVARPGGRDATLILRDLVARKEKLTGADRVAAEAILARPDDGDVEIGNGWDPLPTSVGRLCSALTGVSLCVHWVDEEPHPDAPDLTDVGPDGFPNGVPDYVDLVLATLEETWAREIGDLGYRAPQSDGDSAPNNGLGPETDVYLDDLGAVGVFGYCATDDPRVLDPDFAVSAYCVLDNDYDPSQYGTSQTPVDFLRVTVAHEFFHAVQAAYDFFEDAWFLEGTATNMEETVYPDVDDNVVFLETWSPLTRPAAALDRSGMGDLAEYGSWLFWRFLEEKIAAGDPAIVREVWERADAFDPDPDDPGDDPPDDYSLRAAQRELAERGHVFRDAFARFGTANRLRDYADADAAGYPAVPLTARYRLGSGTPLVDWKSTRINHLATRFFSFVPGGWAPTDGRLRLSVRLPRHGARATVIVHYRSGAVHARQLSQDSSGRASRLNSFGRGQVSQVDLVLSNGSTRTACWQQTGPPWFSCFGDPRDDRQLYRFRAALVPR